MELNILLKKNTQIVFLTTTVSKIRIAGSHREGIIPLDKKVDHGLLRKMWMRPIDRVNLNTKQNLIVINLQ